MHCYGRRKASPINVIDNNYKEIHSNIMFNIVPNNVKYILSIETKIKNINRELYDCDFNYYKVVILL